jgi:hypothetical protein
MRIEQEGQTTRKSAVRHQTKRNGVPGQTKRNGILWFSLHIVQLSNVHGILSNVNL